MQHWYIGRDILSTLIISSVPGHDHAAIGYALDAGASIVVPQVDTVKQAQHIVAAAKFGSRNNGKRSAPPNRWLPSLSTQSCNPSLPFWENQNQQGAVFIQVESLEGINNLHEIPATVGEHVDSVWLGNLDCRVSMSLPGFWGEEPEWVQASIINLTRAWLLATMIWLKERGEGRSVMSTSSDLAAVLRTADDLARVRKMFPSKNDSTANAC